MDPIHSLTIRAATALGRLAELERGAQRSPEASSAVTVAALQELSAALEELQVANEMLQTQLEDLAAAQADSVTAAVAREELASVLPVPALWTNVEGLIEQGNDSACELLNVGRHHLAGRSLVSFVRGPEVLLRAVQSASAGPLRPPEDVDVTVMPFDRVSLTMRVRGRRLLHESRCVWFLYPRRLG